MKREDGSYPRVSDINKNGTGEYISPRIVPLNVTQEFQQVSVNSEYGGMSCGRCQKMGQDGGVIRKIRWSRGSSSGGEEMGS